MKQVELAWRPIPAVKQCIAQRNGNENYTDVFLMVQTEVQVPTYMSLFL